METHPSVATRAVAIQDHHADKPDLLGVGGASRGFDIVMASVLLDIRTLAGSLCSCELMDMQLGSELLRRVLELHPVPPHSIVKLLVDMEPLRLAVPLKEQGISNGSVITYARQHVAPEEEFQIVTKVMRHGHAALSLDESQIWDAAEANLVARLGGAETSSSKNNPGVISPDALPVLWVTKWVDYSSQFGLGYIMSDQSIGVYFNDSTKIILAPEGSCFDYITRRSKEEQEIRTTHNLEAYPDDLKKKVTLLQLFKKELRLPSRKAEPRLEGRTEGTEIAESNLPPPIQTDAQTGLEAASRAFEPGQLTFHEYIKCRTRSYVKKVTRNEHAIMFQLSNKIVQVVFFDKTEAVLSSKTNMVTYVNKKGQVCSYPLSDAMTARSPGLAKCLECVRTLLSGACASDLGGA